MGSGLQHRGGCRDGVESLEARRALPTGPIANTHALCEPARAQRVARVCARYLATTARVGRVAGTLSRACAERSLLARYDGRFVHLIVFALIVY